MDRLVNKDVYALGFTHCTKKLDGKLLLGIHMTIPLPQPDTKYRLKSLMHGYKHISKAVCHIYSKIDKK